MHEMPVCKSAGPLHKARIDTARHGNANGIGKAASQRQKISRDATNGGFPQRCLLLRPLPVAGQAHGELRFEA